MNNVWLILQREYLTRVKKTSFIVMTFLGPILMAALMIVPILLATMEDVGTKKIAILDETGWFAGKFESDENNQYSLVDGELESEKKNVLSGTYDALIYIPSPTFNVPANVELFSAKRTSMSLKAHVRNTIKAEIENRKLLSAGIDPNLIKEARTDVNVLTIRLSEDGTEANSYTEVQVGLGIFSSILIYFFIFLFGSQVMRGVIEEKTNRIVEVIISSVKPFHLMMGKITGIALVGLTQFLLWVVLTGGIFLVFTAFFGSEATMTNAMPAAGMMNQNMDMGGVASQQAMAQIFDVIHSINFGVIIFSFVFYFLGGYLLYAALFAAIGAAVDNEADTQQFMLPVSLPLIGGIVVSNFVVNNPDGPIAFWLSMFPLTSPVLMMVRIPFGVPYYELAASMLLLVAGFIFTTWIAAKIYRTGILMYGKKVNYKELWKWLRY
ncbi:MAG: ABC transporter permease [Bacteroidales bacterium]|nr:ABC transporter permease [Bacteroidales bacterium]